MLCIVHIHNVHTDIHFYSCSFILYQIYILIHICIVIYFLVNVFTSTFFSSITSSLLSVYQTSQRTLILIPGDPRWRRNPKVEKHGTPVQFSYSVLQHCSQLQFTYRILIRHPSNTTAKSVMHCITAEASRSVSRLSGTSSSLAKEKKSLINNRSCRNVPYDLVRCGCDDSHNPLWCVFETAGIIAVKILKQLAFFYRLEKPHGAILTNTVNITCLSCCNSYGNIYHRWIDTES